MGKFRVSVCVFFTITDRASTIRSDIRGYQSGTWYAVHAHFIPIVGVGKRDEYELVHGDLPRQQPFGTTLRLSGPVPAVSRQ